jgi:sugar (pentulose or hexulose) kinase
MKVGDWAIHQPSLLVNDKRMNEVIAIFDIGKTNKKFLLFDKNHELVYQDEKIMPTTVDDDGFECDDIALIEKWIISRLKTEINNGKYDIKGINFSTYGASLVFLNDDGERLAPLYNYLKPVPEELSQRWYNENGGKKEFCRKTASPALGAMLNSGLQIKWLKHYKPEVYAQVRYILHFPQYLSFLFTRYVLSEFTSIGCHTGMWDFDQMKYHEWVAREGVSLPAPKNNSFVLNVQISGREVAVGPGIHDSSASLAPYLLADVGEFILISTGTWCINMNPFNHQPLTQHELENDCLCYLSVDEKPVKSSRFFMGHIHDVNVSRLTSHFRVDSSAFKSVDFNPGLLKKFLEDTGEGASFFKEGVPSGYVDDQIDLNRFKNFDEAYHRLVFDLTRLNAASIKLVMDKNDGVQKIFISGGFARNEIFVRSMTAFFPGKTIFTSQVDNATALGAALVINDVLPQKERVDINLNQRKWESL